MNEEFFNKAMDGYIIRANMEIKHYLNDVYDLDLDDNTIELIKKSYLSAINYAKDMMTINDALNHENYFKNK